MRVFMITPAETDEVAAAVMFPLSKGAGHITARYFRSMAG